MVNQTIVQQILINSKILIKSKWFVHIVNRDFLDGLDWLGKKNVIAEKHHYLKAKDKKRLIQF